MDILLVNSKGDEQEFAPEHAERILQASAKRKQWQLSDKVKDYKFEDNRLVKIQSGAEKPSKKKEKPEAKEPQADG